jgi:TolB-like protein
MTYRKIQKQPTPPVQSSIEDAGRIRKQLERILTSQEFKATERQRDFLQFVVAETIAGKSDEIKGYTVATRVFGRGEDFDQATDPLVSIQANKLRRAIERYYLTVGQRDPVRIDIPKGTYVPIFIQQYDNEARIELPDQKSTVVGLEESWPTVLIRTFKNLTGDPDMDYLGTGLSTELATELTRYQYIRVLLYSSEGQPRRATDSVARFILDGSVRKDSQGIKVDVLLTDKISRYQIWSDACHCRLDSSRLIAFEEETARIIAVKIAGEHGIISKTLSLVYKNKPPAQLKAYEAILRYYEYELTLNSQAFMRAFKALHAAVEIEPDCGQVWSMLGRLYGNVYSLELPGFKPALKKAVDCAQKGVRLNPDNQRARSILGFVLMFGNELNAAKIEVENALDLNPNSLFMLDGIGYIMTLLGDWERGTRLINRVIKLNPFYGLYVHYALWVNWFRLEDWKQAWLETLNFRRPAVFWEPLMKAATLGQLGRVKEGQQAVEELLKLKPDFQSRGQTLIRHYIKFDDIVDRTIEGLYNVGLELEKT